MSPRIHAMDGDDRFAQVSRLYHAALGHDASRRVSFLADACGGDEILRQEVESLLARDAPPTDFLAISADAAESADNQTEPPSHTLVGHTLSHYRIVERLGEGGMGEVYRAHDEQLERDVAIKVLRRATAADPAARARLIREARTASNLNHPNICTIHEVGEADGQAYIAMELVPGQTVSDRLAAGPLAPDEIVRYALQLTDALTHAHERGIVHRDLKSANVIITTDGRLKVLDFGLAKRLTASEEVEAATEFHATITRPGMLVGTVTYMAPEQLRGRAADARSDIWALGVVLYEMATARLPFVGLSAFEIMAAVLETSPPPLQPPVPERISTIVFKCLEKDPAHRFQTAREIQVALQADGGGRVRVSRPRAALSVRAISAMAALAAAAALAIAIGFDVGHLRQRIGSLFSTDVIAFTERDWLLVAGFQNQTADQGFAKALDTALAVGIGQSSYVNLVPASQIQGALRRMKLSTTSSIDETLALEIARREGIKLVLVPSVAEVGGVYQLSGSLEDPATGNVLRSRSVRVPSKEDLLNGLDDLIRQIRDNLGEAARSISQQSRPLTQATTSSMDALKMFSAAQDTFLAGRIDDAIPLYEEALSLDPTFISARAQLGMINFELRNRDKGKELLAQSLTGLDAVTDKERYSILAFHAAAVENNPQKAADYYTKLLAIYPDMWAAHNNLGRAYMQMERWSDAVAPLKQALHLEPNVMLTYNSLSEIYLYHLGDLEAAESICRQQITYNDQHALAYDRLGWTLLGKSELALAREAFQKVVALEPRNTLDLFRIGHTYRLEGRYKEALETFLNIAKVDPMAPAHAPAYYDAGVAARLMGDERAALNHFTTFRQFVEKEIRQDSRNGSLYFELAAVLSRLGEGAAASSAARQATALDPNLHFEHALFLSLQGSHAEAIAQLQEAVDRGFGNFIWMKIHEDLEPLATEPKFQALLAANVKP